MNNEWLPTFTEGGRYVGVSNKNDVHRLGFWHQSFHCFFVTKKKGKLNLIFRLKSKSDIVFPSNWDITCTSHVLVGEEIYENIREINSSFGVVILFDELTSLGLYRLSHIFETPRGKICDNEFCHVFSVLIDESIFELLENSSMIEGLIEIPIDDFIDFINSKKFAVNGLGFLLEHDTLTYKPVNNLLWKKDFVPYDNEYWNVILNKIKIIYG